VVLAMLLVSDSMMVALGLLLAHQVRYLQGVETPFAQGSPVLPFGYLVPIGLLWLLVFRVFGLYERQNLVSGVGEYRRVALAAAMTTLGVIVFAYVRVQPYISRGFLLVSLVAVVLAVVVGRFAVRRFIYARRAAGQPLDRVLVVGSSRHAVSLAAQLMDSVSASTEVVGFLSEYLPRGTRVTRDLPVVGEPMELEEVADRLAVTRALVVESGLSWESLQAMVRMMYRRGAVPISLVPGMLDLHATQMHPHQLGPVMALMPQPARIVGVEAVLKRAFDIVLGLIGVLISVPLLVAGALIARLQGAPLTLRRQVVLRAKGKTVLLVLEGPPWLARLHLARLPALLNVLAGSLSLVGPRPVAADNADDFGQWLSILETAKPGFIGPWWLVGKSEPESKVEEIHYDLHYLRSYSVWMDAHIVVQVARALLGRRVTLKGSWKGVGATQRA
jgi:lipopolysaccharide/colanic/teichoic acid biosynthesis glycosyltransferase